MTTEQFKTLRSGLPTSPGIYKFLDAEGNILYVGKAINIRNRVSSYFKNKYDSAKTRLLAKKTDKIDFTIVDTEQDALLLENLLIKKNQPRYNIQLRDDKTYPHICIKNERFPRIFLTRTLIDDGSEYLGPYTSVKKVRAIIQFLQSIFPLRTCNLNLSQNNIDKGKFKVCLEYHIGNCLGPCENLQSEESYNETISHIRSILKGHIKPAINYLKNEMAKHVDRFEFEKANGLKLKIQLLEDYQSKSTIVTPTINNVDVFAIVDSQKSAFVNYLKVINGSIIQTKTVELKKILNENLDELLIFAITELRSQFQSESKELIVPFKIKWPQENNLKVTVPHRGDKKKLLTLANANATYFKNERDRRKLDSKQKRKRTLELLKEDFRLKRIPHHIECFDNSNFQGTYPVASVVVFRNGKPSKNDYRHYNIKTVIGPNDFASMEEVVLRRYSLIQKENKPLPQLIIIDGGKGQLNAAKKALEQLNILSETTLVSIAKKLEEIYFVDDPLPMHLNKKSPSLKLIQQIRNEAHRFAITFHRTKRKNATLKTSLDEIPGIGEKTSKLLLRTLKSEKKIKQASLDELASLIGLSKAKKIKSFYDQ